MIDDLNSQIQKLADKLIEIEKSNYSNSLKIEDSYALSLLQSLLNGYAFLPFTGSALRPFCLVHMLNDIVINGRTKIIEFGSGISTIIIGRLIKKNNLNATVLSIEHDENWANSLKQILKTENIDDVVTVKYVPLTPCSLSTSNNDWYNLDILNTNIKDMEFDMVIIDGPPAWEIKKREARYPAIPFIKDKLKDNFSIYLDDALRIGEQAIIKKWETDYNVKFNITGKTLAYIYAGKAFYTEPFTH